MHLFNALQLQVFKSSINFVMILKRIFLIGPVIINPCSPSPCGPNSQCREINLNAVCSCVSGFIGSPPSCRPECIINSECPQNQACQNQKCIDPCVGTCGVNAKCIVRNHSPICSCPPRHTGNPFTKCQQISMLYSSKAFVKKLKKYFFLKFS